MIDIAICICTRNRQDGLRKLLDSLMKMQAPLDTKISVVVVENDSKNFSESIVNEFTLKSKIKTNYFLETRQGLAFARNRTVNEAGKCDFCCFVDDDQVVAPDWLVELVKCQSEYDADGVWGPNPPIFYGKVPSYIREFHMPEMYDYGTIVRFGYTNCLLLRKSYLDRIDGPFDLRLNFTGGEDNYLTWHITNLGGIIRYNPNAIAYELIPQNRATIKYVIKRTYNNSNTGLFLKSLIENKSSWNRFPRLVLRFCFGTVIALPFLIFGKSNKLIGVKKIANALGGFLFILGSKNKPYN